MMPAVQGMKRTWPFFCLAALLALTAIVYWPMSDTVDLPPPLTLPQAQALPDERLVVELTMDVSARVLKAGGQSGSWRSLPEAAQHLWVATTMVPDLARDGILTYLVTRPDDAPGLVEVAAACTALGATRLAAVCNEALQVASGNQAVTACRAYVAQEHNPPFVRPPGFTDPYAAISGRFTEALNQDGFEQRSLDYAKLHLTEIIAEPR